MKHFILTSTQFEGQVVYKYDTDGYLVYFSYEADMSQAQREHVLRKMPLTLQGFHDLLGKSKTASIEEVPQSLDFDTFWEAYGHKVKRKRCEPLWKKMSEAERMQCMKSIPVYIRYLGRSGYRGKKDPDGYLRDRMWETDWNKIRY